MITLATLEQATAQQVFDQVARHLLTQNAKSGVQYDKVDDTSEPFRCLYRDPEGRKCAAGCLIADDEYKEEFEDSGWASLVLTSRVQTTAHIDLIRDLQYVHDNNEPNDWLARLRDVASYNHLNPAVLDEFVP